MKTKGRFQLEERTRRRTTTSPGALRTRRAVLILVGSALASISAPSLAEGQRQGPGGARPGGPGGPGSEQEIQLLEQFDVNDDARLDSAERSAARQWLASRGGGARIGGPGGGFPGGPGGGGRGPGGRGIVTARPGIAISPADAPAFPGASLYDPAVVRTIFIDFEAEDWESELSAFYNTDVEVPATVTVDGKTYPNVGIGFRGASSYRMVPEGSKRSLNLSVDFVDDEQRIEGYRTLNLLNAMNDPTFVRTLLYSEIARDYLAAPKVNYARVVINGENWGVYLNAQQFNKDFLDDFYDENDGSRWKTPGSPNGRAGMEYLGDDPAPYQRLYEIKSDDEQKAWADLINLFKVLNQTPSERLEAALEPILDVDGVLKFLALEVALVNTDGYWTRASDYNIYQDERGKFHVIPHDMNEALGVSGNVNLDPLVNVTDTSKPLRSKLLAVPALRERYLGYVNDIATRWLDWDTLGPMVERYQAVIAEHVSADTRKLYTTEAFSADVDALKTFVERRQAFLLN